ncbi:hypothetical protein JCM8547_007020 [Rhodosporidiobolus lusitaniae]
MSFSSLPYDVFRQIAFFLDPDISRSPTEAPSVTRARREVGRTLALTSRNARLVGAELVWRRIVVGFHRNPDLLVRILDEKWMIEHVRGLHVVCGPRKADEALALPLERVLPVFSSIDSLSIATTPPVLDRFFEGALNASNVTNIKRVELISSLGTSADYPGRLLEVLPRFAGARDLLLELRLSSTTTFLPLSPFAQPHLQLDSFFLLFDEVHSSAFHLFAAFLSRLFHLVNPSHLNKFTLYSPYADTSLTSLLSSSPSLTSLTLSFEVGPLMTRLPELVTLLPALSSLTSLSLLVQPDSSAPLIFPSSHPLRALLLTAFPPSLERITLDFDFMHAPTSFGEAWAPSEDVRDFLEERLARGLPLKAWRTVDWHEAGGERRSCTASRWKNGAEEAWRYEGGED